MGPLGGQDSIHSTEKDGPSLAAFAVLPTDIIPWRTVGTSPAGLPRVGLGSAPSQVLGRGDIHAQGPAGHTLARAQCHGTSGKDRAPW